MPYKFKLVGGDYAPEVVKIIYRTRKMAVAMTLTERVAKAICKSRTCEGVACCQWPANGGRHKCPVQLGYYDDAARDAILAVCEDMRLAGEK